MPFLKQPFSQMINVTDPAAVHSLLQNVPDRSRQLTEAIDKIFLGNSAVIFLPSTLSTLVKALSSFDNILLIIVYQDTCAVRACSKQVMCSFLKIKNILNGTMDLYKIW